MNTEFFYQGPLRKMGFDTPGRRGPFWLSLFFWSWRSCT